jgi:prepilin-type processing-associated H-X9-DG protein
MQCTNNLKQYSLAAHNYHDALSTLPALGIGNTDAYYCLSWSVLILPYVEQQAVTDMINGGGTAASVNGTQNYTAGYPSRCSDDNYRPWQTRFAGRACPSDARASAPSATGGYTGGISYRACSGDCTTHRNSSSALWDIARGCFAMQNGRGLAVITDGTSNTMMFGESLTSPAGGSNIAKLSISKLAGGPNAMIAALDPNDRKSILASKVSALKLWKGTRWNDASMCFSTFMGVMPPNSVSAIGASADDANSWMTICLSSNHSGGANVSFADVSVHFISDTINNSSYSGSGDIRACHTIHGGTTDATSPTCGESPYGVIGALSTVASKESKGL